MKETSKGYVFHNNFVSNYILTQAMTITECISRPVLLIGISPAFFPAPAYDMACHEKDMQLKAK